ncbi:MAG: DUF3987 domain-containing protein [Deltaproteobacteria bacterium]|nr:DUF3987 domain-containing protein [Deltaproteobacteria bacterium]
MEAGKKTFRISGEQAQIHAQCREESKAIWAQAKLAPADHPYLIKKGIGINGSKVHDGCLILPLRNGQQIHGLQKIHDNGFKQFTTGTSKAGHYFSIGGTPTDVLYLAEGFATAASIHEATGQPVAVCFDCGNLRPVAEVLRAKMPAMKMVICGDNDPKEDGSNTGKTKATEAALSIGGLVAVVEIPKGAEGSDFNDLASVEGLDAVREQIARAIHPLIFKTGGVANANSANKCSEWPELLPLHDENEQLAYPIDSLPSIIGDAIRSYSEYGQQPLSIIANSALANVSLGCQCHCDVARDSKLTGPISLFFLSVAESGERKSTVDKEFGIEAREWLKEQQHKAREKLKEVLPLVKGWDAIEAGLLNQLKGKTADKTKVQEELNQHYLIKPELPKQPELFLSDTNQASLMNEIMNNSLYGCSLWDDEGGNIVGGNGTTGENATAFFSVTNKFWDGSPTKQSRTGGNRHVEGRRLTANIMIQQAVAQQLIHGNKGLSRGCGLLARFLITKPASTIGFRPYQIPNDMPALREFGNRTVELLNHSPSVDEYDRLDLPLLRLDKGAYNVWCDFYNGTENTLKPYGEFAGIKDVASKIADNAARIAANLHVFQFGVAGEISAETMMRASNIAMYHLTEARRAYGMVGGESPEQENANKLLDWLERKGFEPVTKSHIMQFGPNSTRDKATLDASLQILISHGIVRQVKKGNAQIVEVNPEYVAGCDCG